MRSSQQDTRQMKLQGESLENRCLLSISLSSVPGAELLDEVSVPPTAHVRVAIEREADDSRSVGEPGVRRDRFSGPRYVDEDASLGIPLRTSNSETSVRSFAAGEHLETKNPDRTFSRRSIVGDRLRSNETTRQRVGDWADSFELSSFVTANSTTKLTNACVDYQSQVATAPVPVPNRTTTNFQVVTESSYKLPSGVEYQSPRNENAGMPSSDDGFVELGEVDTEGSNAEMQRSAARDTLVELSDDSYSFINRLDQVPKDVQHASPPDSTLRVDSDEGGLIELTATNVDVAVATSRSANSLWMPRPICMEASMGACRVFQIALVQGQNHDTYVDDRTAGNGAVVGGEMQMAGDEFLDARDDVTAEFAGVGYQASVYAPMVIVGGALLVQRQRSKSLRKLTDKQQPTADKNTNRKTWRKLWDS